MRRASQNRAWAKRVDLVIEREERQGQFAILLSSATVVIGVAIVLLRGSSVPAPDVEYLAGQPVSGRAFLYAMPVGHVPAGTATPAPTPLPTVAPKALTRGEGIRVAIATAKSLIGRPYSYGATGPNAFDCSGFTSYVWRKAGLYIPRTSGSQFVGLPRVPIKSLQAGDILYSRWDGGGHVGLYIGDGKMINAPQTGRRVEISGIRSNLVGAVRPALLLPKGEPAMKGSWRAKR